jgi:hypothetical protein
MLDWLLDQARKAEQLLPFAHSDPNGYEYRYNTVVGPALGSSSDLAARAAMSQMKADPNSFFPFNVRSKNGDNSVKEGHDYDLSSRGEAPFYLPPGKYPVRVTGESPTSFTFTALPGHFDPPGSTITFSTWVDNSSRLNLEQYGKTSPGAEESPALYSAAPTVAHWAWDQQAANMQSWWDRVRTEPKFLNQLWARSAAESSLDTTDALKQLQETPQETEPVDHWALGQATSIAQAPFDVSAAQQQLAMEQESQQRLQDQWVLDQAHESVLQQQLQDWRQQQDAEEEARQQEYIRQQNEQETLRAQQDAEEPLRQQEYVQQQLQQQETLRAQQDAEEQARQQEYIQQQEQQQEQQETLREQQDAEEQLHQQEYIQQQEVP